MEIEIKVEPLDEIKIGVESSNKIFRGAGAPGLVPDPITEDGKFLRDDGTWTIVAGAGDVVGPNVAVNNRIAVFNGTTGKIIKDGGKTISEIDAAIANKVDKVTGKGLSDENYTLTEKNKLAGIEAGAEVNTVDSVNGQTGVVLLGKADVGLGNVDNVQQYPNSNPSAFETPAQLDARDTADRDRANHTGTQAISTVSGLQTALDAKSAETVAATGAVIDFTASKVFNSPASPSAANITDDLTGAKIGIVQKIYHNHSVAPSVPAGWVLIGSGTYTLSTLNIIYAEWVSGTRVEYWIVQPA